MIGRSLGAAHDSHPWTGRSLHGLVPGAPGCRPAVCLALAGALSSDPLARKDVSGPRRPTTPPLPFQTPKMSESQVFRQQYLNFLGLKPDLA